MRYLTLCFFMLGIGCAHATIEKASKIAPVAIKPAVAPAKTAKAAKAKAIPAKAAPAEPTPGTYPVHVAWDANPGWQNIAGYHVHAGSVSKTYSLSKDVGNVTDARVDMPISPKTYVAVTAYNTAGIESLFSDEVITAVPPSAPTPTPPPPPPGALANGSFESDYSGWTFSGNQTIDSQHASNGLKAVAFNDGQRASGGYISQSITTIPGRTYKLTFDAGVTAWQSSLPMQMQALVSGTATLLSKTIAVPGQGTGFWYTAQSYNFIADSTTTTLKFTDSSVNTENIDLLLDNVNVAVVSPIPTPTPPIPTPTPPIPTPTPPIPTPTPPTSALVSLSTRAYVGTGNSVTIAGLTVIGGPGRYLIRGLGPSLPVQLKLANPTLELHMPNGAIISNDNWRDTQAAEITLTHLAPTNNYESAILVTLSPGSYTVTLRGKNTGVGIGLVEVYKLN